MKKTYTLYIDGFARGTANHVKYLKTLLDEFNYNKAEIERGNKIYAVKYSGKPWVRFDFH